MSKEEYHEWKLTFGKKPCWFKYADGEVCNERAYHICKVHGEALCSKHYRQVRLEGTKNVLQNLMSEIRGRETST